MDITGTIPCLVFPSMGSTAYPTGAFEYIQQDVNVLRYNTGLESKDNIKFTASKSWTGKTSAVGSNTPFDIMPPYITAYCWKRIS